MFRSVLSVIVGHVVWTILWLTMNVVLLTLSI